MQVLDACLKEITTALLQADVNVKLVMNLRTNVKTRANNADKGAGLNKRKIIEKAVVDELSSMLSSGSATDEKQLVDLKKGKPNVVMFVGLQVRLNSLRVQHCGEDQFCHVCQYSKRCRQLMSSGSAFVFGRLHSAGSKSIVQSSCGRLCRVATAHGDPDCAVLRVSV